MFCLNAINNRDQDQAVEAGNKRYAEMELKAKTLQGMKALKKMYEKTVVHSLAEATGDGTTKDEKDSTVEISEKFICQLRVFLGMDWDHFSAAYTLQTVWN